MSIAAGDSLVCIMGRRDSGKPKAAVLSGMRERDVRRGRSGKGLFTTNVACITLILRFRILMQRKKRGMFTRGHISIIPHI